MPARTIAALVAFKALMECPPWPATAVASDWGFSITPATSRYSPRSAGPHPWAEQLGRRSPPRLIFEIDISERLSVVLTINRRRFPRLTTVAGSGEQQAFIVVCFWRPLMELAGDRPTDFFLHPEAF